jgi:hypothetical protein
LSFKPGKMQADTAELMRRMAAGQSLSFCRVPPPDPTPSSNRPTLTEQDQINAGLAALAARRAALNPDRARMPLVHDSLPLGVTPPAESRPVALVVTDLELLRAAVKCHQLPAFRLWAYAHDAAEGQGWIEIDALEQAAREVGIVGSRRTLMHLIASGKRLFFRPDYAAGRVYLVAAHKVAMRLARRADDDTNRPGSRRIVIDLSGSLATVEARAYAAWITQKAAKTGYLDISRVVLVTLWGRAVPTLLKWEKKAGIRVESSYAEYHPELADPRSTPVNHEALIPDHAYLCLDKQGRDYVAWQTVNRYFPPRHAAARLHDHAGNTRKLRRSVNARLDSTQPANVRGRGYVASNTGRVYFANSDPGTANARSAHKKIAAHLRKHGDIHKRPHYAYTIKRHRVHIREMSFGEQLCGAGIRDYKGEKSTAFHQRRTAYADYLRSDQW